MKNYFLIVSIIFLSISCKSEKRYEQISKTDAVETIELCADSICSDDFMNPIQWHMTDNRLVILNNAKKDDCSIMIFSPDKSEKTRQYIRKGRAEDEYMSVMWAKPIEEDVFCIYDIPRGKICSYEITADTIKRKNEYLLPRDETATVYPFVCINQLNDSLFVLRQSNRSMDALSLFDLKNQQKISDIEDILERSSEKDQYLEYNYDMTICGDYLIKYYETLPRIEIFEKKGDTFLAKAAIEGQIPSGFDIDEDVLYTDAICMEKYFMALYNGNPDRSAIEIYDYDGHAIKTFELDRHLYIIAVDKESGKLYGYDDYGNGDCLYTYDIKDCLD